MIRRWSVAILMLGGAAFAAVLCSCTRTSETRRDSSPKDENGRKGLTSFTQMAPDCGVNWTYRNGEEAGHLAILESLGGGIALIDYDGDGLLDIFVPGGGYYSKTKAEFDELTGAGKPVLHGGKKVRKSDPPAILGHPCKLYRNLGGWKFKDVTAETGLEQKWFYTHGCAVGDYDCDGWPDLLVTGWGRVALFHNEPVDLADPSRGRKFVDVTAKAGLGGITWASSAAWADLDGDGFPELYVCQYGDWSWDNDPSCQYDGVTDDVCPPKNFSGLRHKLFWNRGNGSFTDVSETVPVQFGQQKSNGLKAGAKDASKGLGVLIVDVNGDSKPDIYVANDTVDKFLYVNRSTKGNLRFEEQALFAGVARDDRGSANGSMGIACADYDGCGRPSLWVTNYENEMHSLYHNDCKAAKDGKPELIHFAHRTAAAGLAVIGQKYVGWGTGFLDIDHKGWEDLIIANGHAIRFPTGPGIGRGQRPVLLRNTGNGKFEQWTQEGGDYFKTEHVARGVALGDLDNDGRIDLVISHVNEPVAVLRNNSTTDGNHWLGIQLANKAHADVVGAKVILTAGGRSQSRYAVGGGSYASANDRRLVFGLGKTDKIDHVTVIWPDGSEQRFDALAVDRYHRLTRGSSATAN